MSYRTFTIAICLAATAAAAQPQNRPGRPDQARPSERARPAERARPEIGTLVKRDLEGRVQRLEVAPEEAAVLLLKLGDEQREAVNAVLSARWAVIDEALLANLQLLIQFRAARLADDAAEMARLLVRFQDVLAPLRQRGPLLNELAAVLPVDKAEELRILVREYRREMFRERAGEGRRGPRGRGDWAGTAFRQELLDSLRREIRQSYNRQIATRQHEFENVLDALDLTADQEARVQAEMQEQWRRQALSPEAMERREARRRAIQEMTPEQRRELRERWAEPGAGPDRR